MPPQRATNDAWFPYLARVSAPLTPTPLPPGERGRGEGGGGTSTDGLERCLFLRRRKGLALTKIRGTRETRKESERHGRPRPRMPGQEFPHRWTQSFWRPDWACASAPTR